MYIKYLAQLTGSRGAERGTYIMVFIIVPTLTLSIPSCAPSVWLTAGPGASAVEVE